VVALAGGSRLEPGRAYPVALELDATAWRFTPGRRLRLVVGAADWPNVWPAPALGSVTLSSVSLVLPAIDLASWDRVELPGPGALPEARCSVSASPYGWRISRDAGAGSSSFETGFSFEALQEGGPSLTWEVEAEGRLEDRRPDAATLRSLNRMRYLRDGAEAVAEASLEAKGCDAGLEVGIALHVDLDGARLFERRWQRDFGWGRP
jgi:hypothetical protein